MRIVQKEIPEGQDCSRECRKGDRRGGVRGHTAVRVCHWCGLHISNHYPESDSRRATREHLIPVAYGGQGVKSGNIVWACRTCNEARGDEMQRDWQKHGKQSDFCLDKWVRPYLG